MPRTQTTFVVFVAGPSDVEDDVTTVREVVSELNRTWRNAPGYHLDLVHWRTDATPGVGTDPQDVINRSIGQEYDILIGLMWTRLGTPTTRGRTGYEEEIRTAIERAREAPGCVEILVFEKTAAYPPSKLDLNQYQRLRAFIDELHEDGVLRGSYANTDQLASELRVHISECARRLAGTVAEPSGKVVDQMPDASHAGPEDDEGLLDLTEMASHFFQRGTEALQRTAEEISELGAKTRGHLERFEALPKRHGNIDVAGSRRIMDTAGDDMAAFAGRLESETPQISEALQGALDCTGRAAVLAPEFGEDGLQELRPLLSAIESMREAAIGSNQSIRGFRAAAAGLPPITKAVKRGRRRMTAALDRLIDETDRGIANAGKVAVLIRRLLGEEADS